MSVFKKYYKNLIKEKSTALRSLKQNIKASQRSLDDKAGSMQCLLRSNKAEMQYIYLSYGVSRGKTIEQIQGISKTPVDMDYLSKVKERHDDQIKALESLSLEQEPA